MAANAPKAPAPLDERTRVPFPIVTALTEPIEVVELRGTVPIADWHHVNFPRYRLLRSAGGMAIMHSRLACVYRSEHDLYHANFGEYDLPETPEDQAELLLYELGGYVSRQGVVFNDRGKAEEVPLPDEERVRLVESGMIDVRMTEDARRFFYEFIGNSLSPRQRASMVRLLQEHDNPRKHEISCGLLQQACERATRLFAGGFAELYEEGSLPLARTQNIGKFVCDLLVVSPEEGLGKREIKRFRSALEAVA